MTPALANTLTAPCPRPCAETQLSCGPSRPSELILLLLEDTKFQVIPCAARGNYSYPRTRTGYFCALNNCFFR